MFDSLFTGPPGSDSYPASCRKHAQTGMATPSLLSGGTAPGLQPTLPWDLGYTYVCLLPSLQIKGQGTGTGTGTGTGLGMPFGAFSISGILLAPYYKA